MATSVALAARFAGAQFVALPHTGHLTALVPPEAIDAAWLHFAAPPPTS